MDKRIATTVAFLLKCPASTVPQAMRACKFSDEESNHAGMQMAVRRARDKALAGKKSPPPPSVTISASRSGKKSMSPLTGSTALAPSSPSTPGSTRSKRSSPKEKPKEKDIRRNSRAMQKVRVNKLRVSSETYLGRYAALQKRNAVAAVLDFTNEEWDSLKRMREADSTNIDLADDNGCNVGALGAENGANGGKLVEEAV